MKAELIIVSIESPIVRAPSKPTQPVKALSPRFFTKFGIIKSPFNCLHPVKALFPIVITFLPIFKFPSNPVQ